MRIKNQIAKTPPMGWNSWDCYAATVTEAQLLENAGYMQKRLLPFGWEYVVCDIQWYEPLAGTGEGEYREFADLCMDGYSRLLPAENRFPGSAGGKGFAPIAEKIHSMGLKFGVHLMRGIPRQAVHRRIAVKGTNLTADKIANPFSICKWNSDMYGVNPSKPGAQEYYNSVFDLFASWGVDYVKVDDICNTNMYPHNPYSARGEIELIRRAIDYSGRPMVLSLSPGPAPIEEAWHLSEYANLWRIFRSPLMMGGILPDNDEWTLSLLTNAEVLDVLKLGASPRQLYRDDFKAIWVNSEKSGRINLAFFNLDDKEQTIRCPLKCIGMEQANIRDLWAGKDLPPVTDEISANLEPHGAVLFRVS